LNRHAMIAEKLSGDGGSSFRRRSGAIFMALGLAALLAALPACFARATQQAPAPASGAKYEVTDETGRKVSMPKEIRRIVSLAPNVTETLFALGLGDRVVGDTDFCTSPPEAKNRPHVGGPVNPSIEQIAALHPDLVVATRAINRLPTVRSLEQVGIPVYATDPRSVDGMIASTEGLGKLLGAGPAGTALAAGMRRRLADLQTRLAGVAPTSAFFVVWDSPTISIGKDTFIADALRHAGARSVIDTSVDWPTVSMEEVVRQQPEYVIFYSADPAAKQSEVAELRHRRVWSDLDALRRGRVVVLSEAITHPSPGLVDAIEELAQTLHPAQFGARPLAGAGGH
jgi:iron complex transport system substrate-binding protein